MARAEIADKETAWVAAKILNKQTLTTDKA
jgi:hypothetical protein